MSCTESVDLDRLYQASREGLARYRPPRFGPFEPERPFVPESFTQLYHTPLYGRLTESQRLRYNQLYGLRSNELFMLFEEGFTRRVIDRIKQAIDERDGKLGECLALMLEEESNHHRMFLDFNRRVLPDAYRDARGHFARPGAMETALLRLLTARPVRWPFMVWLILLLEEFSTAFSRLLIERERSDGLCPDYVQLHRLHLFDEARHVVLDKALIERLLPPLKARRQRLNGWLFRRLLREMVTPKRSGLQVLRTLAAEQPELAPLLPQLESAVRALPHDPGLYPVVLNARQMPLTHALLARYPEFDFSG